MIFWNWVLLIRYKESEYKISILSISIDLVTALVGAMATMSQADSRRMYSWWWDSHISPKNSKWLQENLTDMDANVKAMIKLIEEDADSFARRAEMYYKKRPELMKLVEEFYRAYRALAERYDHATGALRQAHRTMAEAFPNQVPLVLVDDSPASCASEADPRTPETPPPMHALFDPDDLQKDVLGLSSSHFHAIKRNGAFTEESDNVTSRKNLKQLNNLFGSQDHEKFAEGRVRKGLNFFNAEEKERSLQNNEKHSLHARALSESEWLGKSDKEILILKEALAKLEAEKEAGLVQFQKSLERLSKLESEVSFALEDSKGLNERASKAEAEVQNLKEALAKLEAEKVASFLQYQQCLERISNLEKVISCVQEDAGERNERASKAETEAQALKQDLATVKAEKDAALDQYKQSLELISTLENKLLCAEDDARKINERADKAESEVETLKQALTKLTEEKEAAALQYQQCLETISSLEHKISCAQEEAQRLSGELDNGVTKLKGAEEQCLLLERSNQSLHRELESLVLKMGTQTQELTEKQKELGRLWTCVQEERLRFIEAETAFQTLQCLHTQAQEELRSLASELQNRVQIFRDMETHNQSLQDKVLKVEEENKSLNELNLDLAMSMKDMKDEITSLRETQGKLEEELELQVDQRNALQQEIYCLKEELNELNKKHGTVLEQVDAVGFSPECFVSSVKTLQDENSNLKENSQRERSEKVALLEKLEIMEQLLEKNALLENYLSDMSAELQRVRQKIKALEESFQSLLEETSSLVDEKATLITQLQITTENLEKLSEENTCLENSLSDALNEVEGLKAKSKILEDSCQLLDTEKSGLTNEKDTLISQLEITRQKIEDLDKRYTELEEKYSALEKERESTLCKVEELRASLDVEKKEHASFTLLSGTRLAAMETQIHLLQEEGQLSKREFEEELDKSMDSQIEIFVLQKCVQDLGEKNFSLLIKYQKLLEASRLSEKLISELEHENLEQQVKVKSLFDQTNKLRRGMYQLLKALDIGEDHASEDKIGQDQTYLKHILGKVENTKYSLGKTEDENQRLGVERLILVTILEQLRLEAANIEMERNILDQEFKIMTEQFSLLQSEAHKLLEINGELRLKVREGEHKEEVLTDEIKNLSEKLLDIQGAHQNLQKESLRVLEEKRSLLKVLFDLQEKNRTLEEENSIIFGETLSESNLSLIQRNFVNEKALELKELGEDLVKLRGVNGALEEKLKMVEGMLEEVQLENLNLKETLQESENELKKVKFVKDQLNCEIANGRDVLRQKEMELLDAEQKLIATSNEKSELHKIVEDLRREYDEVKMIREDQGKQIFELSEVNDHLSKENVCLCEANWKLEVELRQLNEEHEKSKIREEILCSELQTGKNEIDRWETEAAAFYSELQFSTVCQALFEEKVHELSEAYESFEDQITSKDMDVELLKERINTLEGENGEFKAQLAAYVPAVISLRDCISSLEDHSCLHTKLQETDNEEGKDAEVASYVHVENRLSEDRNAMVPDTFSDLQDLQTRVKSVEKAVIEMKRLGMQEILNVNTELEAAMRQIEELKYESSLHRENIRPTSETSEAENGLLTKDIMLDHISECSSYGISRTEHVDADNQMLEVWETADQDGSIDLTVGKAKKEVPAPAKKDIGYHRIEAVKEKKSSSPTSEMLVEKELGVDKLEISKRFTGPHHEGNRRKILERLNSDVQKLTNLQITVQDLKRKVDITEKSKKGKAIVECDTVKGQLEETEAAILKLFNLNGKLMKNIEDSSFTTDGKSAMESEESGSVRRKRIPQQARRISERIGQLQLEIQKIQFVLLKIDDEKESKGRTSISEAKRRVLLRDYLYGGVRTSPRRKKAASFCACVPTKGE
ncbi:hypothetical protein F0562_002516 [Nyssa sinensis]|uniref:NAB domain-containing protein n=1 Tax=Nyssa sinensis TaxID=561372 RepID=A0A5J5C9R3_9ASTE|nr:hypothetical protein F0562_002516 [Nyssa sinensis]